MTFSVCFIERREGDSPSIERVFRTISGELHKANVTTQFISVPYGNGFLGTFLNLVFFRPPEADIFHITGHVNYLGLTLPRKKTVLTVHDLTILDLRSGVRRWLIEKLFFTWPSRRLKFLTSISEATRGRLAASAHIEAEKIRVIENPLLIAPNGENSFNAGMPRILQIGTAPNKNVERLVEAVAGLGCQLHIVGGISAELNRRIRELNIPLINDAYLDDAAIEDAYRQADIVTLCSTDEGFGLPIIEGQANGAVVITSDLSPMKEVAGGAAILADPESAESIRDAILSVTSNADLREATREKGRINIRRFERSHIAGQYLFLYKDILHDLSQ